MKTIIAAALFATATVAQAQAFDYQKSVGSSELYPTLITEQAPVDSGNSGGNFAYQESIGSSDLFPTLNTAGTASQAQSGPTLFEFHRIVDSQELDPSLS